MSVLDNKFKKEETDEDYIVADHTLVDESLRGHGIAEQLLDKLVTDVVWKFQENPDKYDHINYEKQKQA
ncbi:hypothetical protein CAR_c12380 [Carnobacterium sp. 17-4]|nr:hypothetical protein CAR_c12380 [Carnobacterium sp. 17-4]